MDFRQLESFVAVYETKSFATASRLLFISQPAVSQQLRSLEGTLGVTLLNRDRHSVMPTREGDLFYPYAKRLLALLQEAQQTLRPDTPAFRLHFVQGDVHDPIQRVLLRFYTENPGASVEILPPVPLDRYASAGSLVPGHLYLVRKSWLGDDAIHFFPLGHARYSVLLSPDDANAAKESLRFSDLAGYRFLVQSVTPANGPFMASMRREMAAEVSVSDLVPFADFVSAQARLLSGSGKFALVLPYYVQVAGEENLSRVPFLPESREDPIGLAFTGQPSGAVSAFLHLARGCYDRAR